MRVINKEVFPYRNCRKCSRRIYFKDFDVLNLDNTPHRCYKFSGKPSDNKAKPKVSV